MISVLLLLIVLQTGAASNQGASAHQNIALNIVPEAVTLELGKPIEREFSADQGRFSGSGQRDN